MSSRHLDRPAQPAGERPPEALRAPSARPAPAAATTYAGGVLRVVHTSGGTTTHACTRA
ncbi:hypothetical protein [Kitasatospora sp. NPDC005856]|uniref:hypothetical protein n=1 Tax=Kitasatospora sp. NPDC005856 TaxID=3154566 RepID=UPI0033E50B94